jgi:aconitate hydratase
VVPIWEAARRYGEAGQAAVIVAGERYGTGSSRDWAAKGQRLLGVRAVIAPSFERIHRSNLIGMGILPIRLADGWGPARLALRPGDRIEVDSTPDALAPRAAVPVTIVRASGERESVPATAAVETRFEVELLRDGGVLPHILRGAIPRAA